MVIHEAAAAKLRRQNYHRSALEGKNNKSRVAWIRRHSMWLGFVESLVNAFKCASGLPLGPEKYSISAAKSERHGRRRVTVLICSPHPDDEALVGGFALRALQESNARVINCAITLGGRHKTKAGTSEGVKGILCCPGVRAQNSWLAKEAWARKCRAAGCQKKSPTVALNSCPSEVSF